MSGPIPISPSSIANAVNFPLNQQAPIPTNITNAPPEGPKFIPVQVGFSDAPVKLLDMGSVTPTSPFSQLCSIYVDATACQYDVNIFFPSTGYTQRIQFGDSAMIPVLTNKATPRFYVISDSGGATSTDVVNLFLNNFYIPPSETSIYQRSIAYGYSSYYALQPTFTQSQSFTLSQTITGASGFTIIPNQKWFITAININVVATAGSGQVASYAIDLQDNGTTFANFLGICNSGGSLSVPVDSAGMNFVSSGTGHLGAYISGSFGNIAFFQFAINIQGGILAA